MPHHEKSAKADQMQSKSCVHSPPLECNDEENHSRYVRIFFGDFFCLEGTMALITALGTVMTYRVFDFDLGFGLVFAFMSAFLSSMILISINCARMRGRKLEVGKALQRLLGLMMVICTVCLAFLAIVDFPDIELSWWRVIFGLTWFVLHLFSLAQLLVYIEPSITGSCSYSGQPSTPADILFIPPSFPVLPAIREKQAYMDL